MPYYGSMFRSGKSPETSLRYQDYAREVHGVNARVTDLNALEVTAIPDLKLINIERCMCTTSYFHARDVGHTELTSRMRQHTSCASDDAHTASR